MRFFPQDNTNMVDVVQMQVENMSVEIFHWNFLSYQWPVLQRSKLPQQTVLVTHTVTFEYCNDTWS